MTNLFGQGIPALLDYAGIAFIIFCFVNTLYKSSLVKFRYETYNKEDAMLTGFCFLLGLLIILSYFFRSKIAVYIFYYLYNFMLFLAILGLINAFVLANSKYKYTSILGEGDKYKHIMKGIVKRRHYGFGLLLLVCIFLRLAIQIYPKGGKVFLFCIFITFISDIAMYYMYSKNDNVIARGTKNKAPKGNTESETKSKPESEDNKNNSDNATTNNTN